MGVFRHSLEIGDPAGRRFETVDAVVGTGASFTIVPSAVLRRLGVVPQRKVSFRLANGTAMEREVGETVVRIDGNRATRMVVFGGENDPPLLGADTLEGLLLTVDPVAKRLVPAEAYLLRGEAL